MTTVKQKNLARHYLTFAHGLWLLRTGLRETLEILSTSSDAPI